MVNSSKNRFHPSQTESELSDWENFTKQVIPLNSPISQTSPASQTKIPPGKTESDLSEWENYKKQISSPNNPISLTSPDEESDEFPLDEDSDCESVQQNIYRPRRSTRKTPEKLAQLEAKLLRKLKSKEIRIEAKLDLHGCTQKQARDKLFQFVRSSYARQHKIVLVVTGKGGSERNDFGMQSDRGIIRRMLPKWLTNEEFLDYVVASSEAFRWDGGEGARYVQIRRKRK